MKKALSIFIALNLLGIGINFVLQAGLGCDAITMLNDGIAKALNINYTISGLIYNTLWIMLALLFASDLLGWGSVLYAYGTGIFIDIYQKLLEPLAIASSSIGIKVLALLLGQLMICLAFAMLIEFGLGRSSLDAILAKLETSINVPYRILKTITDIIFVIFACLLGSTFGFGTVVCMVSGGYTIDFLCQHMRNNSKVIVV